MNNVNSSLSLISLLGIVGDKIPLGVFQPFLDKSMRIMQQKHPRIFDRLSSVEESSFATSPTHNMYNKFTADQDFIKRTDNQSEDGVNFKPYSQNYAQSYHKELDFIIDATDLPFVFYLKPSVIAPVLKAIKRSDIPLTTATIRGELKNLLNLFEGTLDGDAAFFSKVLTIEGSTAAVVALRNAIDGEDMDIIKDLSDIFKPFNKVAQKFLNFTFKRYNHYQNTLEKIVTHINYNTNQLINEHALNFNEIYEELDEIKQTLNKINKEQIRKKSDYSKA
ncbi:putative SCP2 sterol-binding domain-containing protein [Candidatus Hepatincolaceae symbiont of Richtersius coronifer]